MRWEARGNLGRLGEIFIGEGLRRILRWRLECCDTRQKWALCTKGRRVVNTLLGVVSSYTGASRADATLYQVMEADVLCHLPAGSPIREPPKGGSMYVRQARCCCCLQQAQHDGLLGVLLQKNQIILIEGSHTLTSSSDTNPSRLGGTGVLQCQIVSR